MVEGGMEGTGAVRLWRSLFRIGVGVYWLYFAATKWPAPIGLPPSGADWVHPIMIQVSRVDPLPGARELMAQVVLPNWHLVVIGETVAETVVGVLLIVGLATRPAAVLGTLLALGLSLTVAFANADVGLRWLYYLPVLATFEVFVNGAGSLAVERASLVPRWLSS